MSRVPLRSPWRYVEPCCGSAAIALALWGARRPLLPYQGSKWRYRRALQDQFLQAGFEGVPGLIELYDVGPWGIVAPTVLNRSARAGVVDQLTLMARLDPRSVYDQLHHHPVPRDSVTYSAQFLFLQRLAYSGKAVGDAGDRWSSPGFNTSSAYGLPGTERFGQVNPMIPSLIRVLQGYDAVSNSEPTVVGARCVASVPSERLDRSTLVYLDPPYQGSTAYPAGDLDRTGVVAIAEGWHGRGARVVISEAGPIPALVERGWTAQRLDAGRSDTSPFRGKQEEWITLSPPDDA